MRREYGSIVEIEKGKRYQIFWTSNGRRHSKRISGNRKDASEYLATIQAKVVGVPHDVTYDAYWASTVKPSFSNLAPKTVYEYERLWRVELQPRIGSYMITATKYRNAQTVIDSIQPPSVQGKCRTLWHKICNMAIRDEILQSNPLQAVTASKHTPKTKTILDRQQTISLLDAISGVKYEPLILCSVGMGLRPEETYALDWDDLSFVDGYCIATINKTLVTINGKAHAQSTTKTETSNREAICAGLFAERLKALANNRSGPLCPSPNGHTSPSTIAHNWRQWCKRNNIQHISFENMRTLYKTHSAAAMIPAELVRLQMGHKGLGVAEQHYLVVNRALLRTVADLYAAYFAPNRTT